MDVFLNFRLSGGGLIREGGLMALYMILVCISIAFKYLITSASAQRQQMPSCCLSAALEAEPEHEVVTFSHFGDDLSLKIWWLHQNCPAQFPFLFGRYIRHSTFFSYFPILRYSDFKIVLHITVNSNLPFWLARK